MFSYRARDSKPRAPIPAQRSSFYCTSGSSEKEKLCPSLYSNTKAALEEGRGAAWVVGDMDKHGAASAGKEPFPVSGSGRVGEIFLRSYVECWAPLRTQALTGSVRKWEVYRERKTWLYSLR